MELFDICRPGRSFLNEFKVLHTCEASQGAKGLMNTRQPQRDGKDKHMRSPKRSLLDKVKFICL